MHHFHFLKTESSFIPDPKYSTSQILQIKFTACRDGESSSWSGPSTPNTSKDFLLKFLTAQILLATVHDNNQIKEAQITKTFFPELLT